jgi:hypothetical protein
MGERRRINENLNIQVEISGNECEQVLQSREPFGLSFDFDQRDGDGPRPVDLRRTLFGIFCGQGYFGKAQRAGAYR